MRRDLVYRDEIMDSLVKEYNRKRTNDGLKLAWIEKAVNDVKPAQQTGHWIPVGMTEAVGGESAMWGSAVAYHVCSECREQALEEDGEEKLSDFCPHCGAKMEGTT